MCNVINYHWEVKHLSIEGKLDFKIISGMYRTRQNIVTDLINTLPGNISVNTVQYATLDEAVFFMSSAPRPVLLTDQ
jgi:hypothetical protein